MHRRISTILNLLRQDIAAQLGTDFIHAACLAAGHTWSDAAVVQLGDDQFLPRLQTYLDLAATLRQRVPAIDYVDMRFDDRVYVRPAGKPVRALDKKR